MLQWDFAKGLTTMEPLKPYEREALSKFLSEEEIVEYENLLSKRFSTELTEEEKKRLMELRSKFKN